MTAPTDIKAGATSGQLATFRLDGDLYGIEVEHVQEVLRSQGLTRVPLAPAAVAGLINLRGQVVSIFNLNQFIFAGVLAFLLLGEVPKPRFYLASALVVAGGVIVVMRPKPIAEAMQKEAALLEE